MDTLYYSPGAASLVVHWLLIETGTEHRLQRVDLDAGEQRSEAYLKLNPNGVVPTFVSEGRAIAESAAIVMHLADEHIASGLVPPPRTIERAQYYQWMLHLANTLQPAFRHWFYPNEAAGEGNADAAKQAARTRIETTFARIDAQLARGGPYLLGARPSAADFFLTMLMRWSRNMPKPATEWPQLAELATLMKARPSWKELYAREGLEEWA